jgi:hypothetical protein
MMANLKIEALSSHSPNPNLSPQSGGASLANGGITMHIGGAVRAWNHDGCRNAQEHGEGQRLEKTGFTQAKTKKLEGDLRGRNIRLFNSLNIVSHLILSS